MSGGGNDVINLNKGGNDVVDAGTGRDIVNGGAGNDVIRGGADGDILDGGAGNDRIYADTEIAADQAIIQEIGIVSPYLSVKVNRVNGAHVLPLLWCLS